MRIPVFLPILLALAGSAHADEVWTTEFGEVTYLSDTRGVAIWEDSNFDETRRFYFPGLAGNFDARGIHDGYWIQAGGQACRATMTGPDGYAGQSWGRLRVVFHSTGFPSNWTLMAGLCFEDMTEALRGTAKVSK